MLTLVGNLILASLALLVGFMAEAGYDSALSPLPPHGPITTREVVLDALVIFWFAGAVMLFYRKRTAWWVGSLIGIGASVCFFTACLVAVVGSCVFPSSDNARDWVSGGRIILLLYGGGMALALLAATVGLFVSLIRMHKDLR